jgi:hypothetical protein
MLRIEAKVAGKLAGELGRAAATNRREGFVTMFWNLSRAVMENVTARACVAILKPEPLRTLVVAQNSSDLIEDIW